MKNSFDIIKNYWWLILIGVWLTYSIFFSADRDSTGNVTKSGWVAANELKVGDCILDDELVAAVQSEDEEFYQYWVTPCKQEHSAEIFYKYDIGNDYIDYPGTDSFGNLFDEKCAPAFANYVGLTWDEILSNYSSEIENLYFASFYPLEDSWYLLKDMDCVVFLENGELMTGSVKDLFK